MEAVQELIKDQDVNAADENDGSTALHEAAINGSNVNLGIRNLNSIIILICSMFRKC